MHLDTSACSSNNSTLSGASHATATGLGQEAEPRSHHEHAVRGPMLQAAIVEQVEVETELVQPVEYEQEAVVLEQRQRWTIDQQLGEHFEHQCVASVWLSQHIDELGQRYEHGNHRVPGRCFGVCINAGTVDSERASERAKWLTKARVEAPHEK